VRMWLYVRLSECRGTGTSCQKNSHLPPDWWTRKRRQWDSLVVDNGASTHTPTPTHSHATHTHTHTHTQCMYECMAQYTHGKEKVTMFLCMCVYRSVRFVAQLNRRDQLLLANASPTLAARARCVSFYPSWSLSIYLSIYLSIHAPAHFTTHSNNGIQTHWPTLLRHLRECVCVCSCRKTRGTISTVFSLVYPE